MRKYQPIWNALKETANSKRECRITAPPPLHRRIIKAVMKEKDQDTGYKYLLGEQGKRARLSYTIDHSVITFTLQISIGLSDL